MALRRRLRAAGRVGVQHFGRVDRYLGLSRKAPDTGDVVLVYHAVGDPGKYGNVSTDRFRRDLEYLTEAYEVVDLPEVVDHDDRKGVAVTFDDGYHSFYTEALPVLREFEVPATVFVVSGFLDDRNADRLWRLRESPTESDYGERQRPAPAFPADGRVMLTGDQLRALVDEPLVTVGNHTATHPDLKRVGDLDRLTAEIEGAKRDLEARLGVGVDRFSYPYGRVTEAAERVVRDAHEVAVTTATRPVPDRPDPYRLPRFPAQLPEWRLRWELTDLRWQFSTLRA